MANENNFKDTVNSLFKGLDTFISAKTVVGEAVHVGDTIILPLVDVSVCFADIICFADKKFPTLLRGEFLSLSFMLFQLFRISDKKYIHTSF